MIGQSSRPRSGLYFGANLQPKSRLFEFNIGLEFEAKNRVRLSLNLAFIWVPIRG